MDNSHPDLLKKILEEGRKGKISKELGVEMVKVIDDTRDAFLRLREAS